MAIFVLEINQELSELLYMEMNEMMERLEIGLIVDWH